MTRIEATLPAWPTAVLVAADAPPDGATMAVMPDAAERARLAAYREALGAILERRTEALAPILHRYDTALEARLAGLDAALRADRAELAANREAETAAVETTVDAELAALMEAYPGCDEVPVWHDEDGLPVRCAITGMLIVDGDEILTDPETGEMFLRAALGLSAREAVVAPSIAHQQPARGYGEAATDEVPQ